MSGVLKGNFKTKNEVKGGGSGKDVTLEERFEKEALKRLGGSIAFVSKKKVLWDAEKTPPQKSDKGGKGR
jgi:hypothetical protein